MRNFSALIFLATLLGFSFSASTSHAQDAEELLKRHAVEFQNSSDVIELLSHIDRERLVLLGEASHGTSQFYTKRAALSQSLIKEKNFRFVAVEADWSSMSKINEFVQHKPYGPQTLSEAMKAIERWPLWMWRNMEFKNFVEWLRDYNENLAPNERVGLYGVDVYDNRSVMDDVLSWINSHNVNQGRVAEQAYSCKTRHPNTSSYIQMVARTGQDCSDDLNEVLRIVRQIEQSHDTDPWKFFKAEQGAKVAINAEKHYRANLQQSAASWNYRANHFYLTAERLLEYHQTDSRGIVWAHNTHIGDARATDMHRAGMVNIGQLSRQELGTDNVFAIGFGTYEGEVLAAFNWEGDRQKMVTPPAQTGSWEFMLNEIGLNNLYLVFNDESMNNALSNPIPHRAIGVTYNPQNEQNNYVQTVLPERYDAFIFIRNTDSLNPLD